MTSVVNQGKAQAASKSWLLLTASLVSSLIMLDSNIVAVSLPAIGRSLGASFTDVQWVISAYVLTYAALLMASGVKQRRILGSSALCVLGPCTGTPNRGATWTHVYGAQRALFLAVFHPSGTPGDQGLVDLETNNVVDLLRDREATTGRSLAARSPWRRDRRP
jgi:MFS family permease